MPTLLPPPPPLPPPPDDYIQTIIVIEPTTDDSNQTPREYMDMLEVEAVQISEPRIKPTPTSISVVSRPLSSTTILQANYIEIDLESPSNPEVTIHPYLADTPPRTPRCCCCKCCCGNYECYRACCIISRECSLFGAAILCISAMALTAIASH